MRTLSDASSPEPELARDERPPAGNGPIHVDPSDDPSRPAPVADEPGNRSRPEASHAPSRSAVVPRGRGTVRSWPLLVLAAPAAAAVWSGWVGIGQMTGFGEIRPLPGIWDSLHIDTAVTLPIGVEAYAAFALRAWLTSSPAVSDRTRRFARWSAIAALILGMAGQVAYHLLAQAGITRAPWEVTTLVSCLPVLVLGLGSALAHMLRSDVARMRGTGIKTDMPYSAALDPQKWAKPHSVVPTLRGRCRAGSSAGSAGYRPSAALLRSSFPAGVRTIAAGNPRPFSANEGCPRPPARVRLQDAQAAAARLIASGRPISRRSLRSAGLHGSNADLGMLAHQLRRAP